MSAIIQIQGQDNVHRMLRRWTDPKLTPRLQTASKLAVTVYKAPLKSAAAQVSRRMARAVSVKRNKRAVDRPGSHIYFRRKAAFFAPFVIGGTRDHGPRQAKSLYFYNRAGQTVRVARVRGVRANPMVARVAMSHQRQATIAFERAMEA